MSIRILHLEDNPADAELIRWEIIAAFKDCEVLHVLNKKAYENALVTEKIDLVISDYNVPGILGLESLEMVRNTSLDIPFIYVSGAVGEEGAVEMLKHGATDYVLKSKLKKLPIAITKSLDIYHNQRVIKEKEEEIKKQELRYRNLIERLSKGFITVSPEGTIVIANASAALLLGYTTEELIGKQAAQILQIPLSGKQFFDHVTSDVVEAQVPRKNGDLFWAQLGISLHFNEAGAVESTSVILRDITTKKTEEVRRRIIAKLARKLSNEDITVPLMFRILENALREYIPTTFFLALLRSENGQMQHIYQRGATEKTAQSQNKSLPKKLLDHILNKNGAIWLRENELKQFEKENEQTASYIRPKVMIATPLMFEDETVGVIAYASYEDESTFNTFHFRLLHYIGEQLGVFVKKVEAEQDRNRILQLSEDLICIVQEDGKMRYTNPAFHKQLGYEKEDLLQKDVGVLFHPDDDVTRKYLPKQLKSGKQRFTFECKIMTKKGKVRYISWRAISQEKDSSFYCIGRDFTEKRANQKRIEESESEYRGLFQRMNEGLILSDEEGRILKVNPRLCSMLGYSQHELLGEVGYDLLHDSSTSQRLRRKIKYRKDGKAGLYETLFLHKNGTEVWAQVSSTPVYHGNGSFKGIMSIILNVSERKEVEAKALAMKEAFTRELETNVAERTEALEDTKKELAISLKKEQELGRLKSRFVSTASHQFRTPLSIIQSNIGILSMQIDATENDFNPEQFRVKFDKVYSRIKEQIERMTHLMNDVLILGKINEGNVALRMRKQPIVPMCQDILDSFTNISEFKRILLEVKGTPREILVDQQLLDNALSNIISNAIKYSPENKPPKVAIKFKEEHTEISVSDEGIGIPEEELEHLFDPFYRATNAKDYTGTGLGTAIAKEYIELMGGFIHVQSTLGKGSNFTLHLKN